jgi:hypothetical protein
VQSPMLAKIERTVTTPSADRVEVFEATTVIGESTNLAIDAGLQWLAEHPPVASHASAGENDNGATPDDSSDVTP